MTYGKWLKKQMISHICMYVCTYDQTLVMPDVLEKIPLTVKQREKQTAKNRQLK